jgi:hypothetical protein
LARAQKSDNRMEVEIPGNLSYNRGSRDHRQIISLKILISSNDFQELEDVDTSVFVHSFDDHQPAKKERSLPLIQKRLRTGLGMISTVDFD